MRSPLLALIAAASATLAQEPVPELVQDLNQAVMPGTAQPASFCFVGDTIYFSAYSRTTGTEFWKTDGTPQGTMLVKDIVPGTSSSNPTGMTAVGGTIFFAAQDNRGVELWKSDGTAEGTVRVKDIADTGSSYPRGFKAVDNLIYFSAAASLSSSSRRLWKSDGTATGTVPVPMTISVTDPQRLTVMDGTLYFANHGFTNQGLYKVAPTGIVRVQDLSSGPYSEPYHFTIFKGALYYRATAPADQIGMWKSDGTPEGTQFIIGGRAKDFSGAQLLGEDLYFVSSKALWRTDGTAAGTVLIKDFDGQNNYITALEKIGNKLCLSIRTEATGHELWISDGTEEGTMLLKDIAPGEGHSTPSDFMRVGNLLYFYAFTPELSRSVLWRTDGTPAGTIRLADIRRHYDVVGDHAVLGNVLYLQGLDASEGRDLWRSDGTVSGTAPVEGTPRDAGSSNPAGTLAFKRGVIFTASDGIHGTELWHASSDGSAPVMLGDLFPGATGSSPKQMTVAGDQVYFVAKPSAETRALYASDGTPAGTRLLRAVWDPNPETTPDLMANFTALGDMLVFTHDDGVHGNELWCSRGDAASTMMLKDIHAGGASWPRYLAVMNGVLYFFARDVETGQELWRSDGTSAGTQRVVEILPGTGWNDVNGITVMGDALYFRADDSVHGVELWKSDGTAAGTMLLKDLSLYTNPAIENLVTAGSRIFFTATTTSTGTELWTSDGTATGTVMLDIDPGIANASPQVLTPCGSKVFFTASGAALAGRELWVSDGTAAGTLITKDIYPGIGNSLITDIVKVEDRVYFAADDGIHGKELWTSDGTAAGTAFVADLAPGSGGSSPSGMAFSDGRLFFSATTEVTGTELFSMPAGRHLEVRASTAPPSKLVLDEVNVGSPPTGTAAAPVTLTLRNHGLHPLDLSEVTLGGPQAAEFQITVPGDLSLPRTLQRGESVELTVLFTPAATGVRSATLRILSTDYDEPDRTVTLLGFGNTAPLFSGHQVTVTTNPMAIPRASILASASDADGDVLKVTLSSATSTQGGRLEESGAVIIYFPPPGLIGSDSFGVVIDDGHGQNVSGTVTVNIPESGVADLGLTLPRMELIEGDNRGAVRFKGIPGAVYRVLRSTDLKVWEEVEVKTLGQDGVFDWDDAEAPYPRAFYQIEGPGF